MITKMVAGPGSHEEWLDSWRVYRTVLISLGAVSSGALELYAEGIRRLVLLYPAAWGDILLAEEEMRFEHWDRMQEQLLVDPDPKYNTTRPWDFIVAQSAFSLGANNRCHGWWQEHLVAGLCSSQPTQKITDALIGRSSRGPAARTTNAREVAMPPGARTGICREWNKGTCSHPCPGGYQHICATCKQGRHGSYNCQQGKGSSAKGPKAGRGPKGKGPKQQRQ